ncbi:MAG: hypothetical protein J0L99_21930 [Chitinophagales bacterium]|nr:hypothetical protein [Chitinophagales bacterium]
MKKMSVFTLLAAFSLLACNQSATTPVVNTPPAPQPVGGNKDANGCLSAAGYQWSALKKECIRLFEQGIRLDAKAKGMDNTVSAFIVFKSAQDEQQAELFLPGKGKSILLQRNANEGNPEWAADTFRLYRWKDVFVLKGKTDQTLYESKVN